MKIRHFEILNNTNAPHLAINVVHWSISLSFQKSYQNLSLFSKQIYFAWLFIVQQVSDPLPDNHQETCHRSPACFSIKLRVNKICWIICYTVILDSLDYQIMRRQVTACLTFPSSGTSMTICSNVQELHQTSTCLIIYQGKPMATCLITPIVMRTTWTDYG